MEQLIIIREGNKWIYAYEGITIRGISTCCKISHPSGSKQGSNGSNFQAIVEVN